MKTARRALVVLLAAALLAVPAIALAKVKRGYYIDVKSQTYIQTNKAATSIKSFTLPCLVGGEQQGGNSLTKPIRLSKSGAFTFKGKSTLRAISDAVVTIKVTGRISGNSAKGKVQYLSDGVSCEDRSFTAKYYGVNPQG
jgi:hypothetical protein